MKSRINISDNSLNIKTPISVLTVFALAGLFMVAAGVYYLEEIKGIDHLLIGMGIIFMSGGLFFLLNSKYYKILVNEEPGYLSLVESTSLNISPMKIPFRYFKEIVVQHLITKENAEYEIMLKSRLGSLHMLAKYPDEKRAMKTAEELEQAMGLKLVVNSEIPYDYIDRTKPYVPINLVLPKGSTIHETDKRSSSAVSWKNTYHPLQFIFMLTIYYGFFHIITFSAVPSGQMGTAAAIVIYTFLGLVLSGLIAVILSSIFGRNYLIISRESIRYYQKVFGRKSGEQEIRKEEIALIRSSLEHSNQMIIVASRKGIGTLNNMIKKMAYGNGSLKKMLDIDDLLAFKEEIMRVNVSTLRLVEKLYIEQFILQNL